jgi:hypothetical protein
LALASKAGSTVTTCAEAASDMPKNIATGISCFLWIATKASQLLTRGFAASSVRNGGE